MKKKATKILKKGTPVNFTDWETIDWPSSLDKEVAEATRKITDISDALGEKIGNQIESIGSRIITEFLFNEVFIMVHTEGISIYSENILREKSFLIPWKNVWGSGPKKFSEVVTKALIKNVSWNDDEEEENTHSYDHIK